MTGMTKDEYTRYVAERAPKSKVVKNTALAWLVGGGICVLGEALAQWYMGLGLEEKPAFSLASMTLIFLAAALTALHIYDNIAKWAGGGTLVPITGFSNAMVSPAMEFKSEGMVAGMAARMFSIAGPVLVFGIIASTLYGAVLALLGG